MYDIKLTFTNQNFKILDDPVSNKETHVWGMRFIIGRKVPVLHYHEFVLKIHYYYYYQKEKNEKKKLLAE